MGVIRDRLKWHSNKSRKTGSRTEREPSPLPLFPFQLSLQMPPAMTRFKTLESPAGTFHTKRGLLWSFSHLTQLHPPPGA